MFHRNYQVMPINVHKSKMAILQLKQCLTFDAEQAKKKQKSYIMRNDELSDAEK